MLLLLSLVEALGEECRVKWCEEGSRSTVLCLRRARQV